MFLEGINNSQSMDDSTCKHITCYFPNSSCLSKIVLMISSWQGALYFSLSLNTFPTQNHHIGRKPLKFCNPDALIKSTLCKNLATKINLT